MNSLDHVQIKTSRHKKYRNKKLDKIILENITNIK